MYLKPAFTALTLPY